MIGIKREENTGWNEAHLSKYGVYAAQSRSALQVTRPREATTPNFISMRCNPKDKDTTDLIRLHVTWARLSRSCMRIASATYSYSRRPQDQCRDKSVAAASRAVRDQIEVGASAILHQRWRANLQQHVASRASAGRAQGNASAGVSVVRCA
jgi:hypothetical protein